MKRMSVNILVWLLACACVLPMFGCRNTEPDVPVDEPPLQQPEDAEPDMPTDTPASPTTLADRKVEIVDGSAIHENTLGRIPQGLAEVVNKYMTQAEAMEIIGDTTAFQTVQSYSITQEFGTDAVFVHCATQDVVESVIGSWEKQGDHYNIYMMTVLNRAELDDFEAWNAKNGYSEPVTDDIMTLSNGSYKGKADGNTYYMIPTERFTEYVWDMVSTAMDNADLAGIVFEEPDLYRGTGYAPAFKRAWEAYYGEDWQSAGSSPEAMLKSNRLLVTMMNDMMAEITSRIREKNADLKIYLAVHSTPSYNSPGNEIAAGLGQYFRTDMFDGLIGQTWTNTANVRLTENGQTVRNPFAAAYIGYASYVDVAGERALYAVADAVGDGIGKNTTEADFYKLYYATVVAQLMQPEINRFNLLTWPERSFDAVTEGYRTTQLSVIAAQTEAAGAEITYSAGTPGITYLLSDTLSWQNGNEAFSLSTHDALTGVVLPLVTDGIPLKIKSLDMIESAEHLSDVNPLLLSFDCQKPLSRETVEAIAAWIKNGGVCLYLGGRDAYDGVANMWWSESGSPLQALLNMLELDIVLTAPAYEDGARVEWQGHRSYAEVGMLTVPTEYSSFLVGFDGDINEIASLGGCAVGIDQPAGKGRLVAIGLPSVIYAQNENGSDAMRSLAEYACQYTAYAYDSTTLMWAKRGNVVAAHAIGAKNVLTGKYIDLFDPMLAVYTHKILEADASALLYDLTDMDLSIPRLAFSGGHITDLTETANETSFTLTSTARATVALRLACADGTYPERISVKKGRVELEFERAWDNASDTLLLHVVGDTKGVTVTVTWGRTPVEDSTILSGEQRFDYEPLNADTAALYGHMHSITVPTTKATEQADAAFVWRSSAQSTTDRKYCDLDAELIYRFDLKTYTNAVVALEIMQNYLVQVSTDGESWRTVQNYIDVNGLPIKGSYNAATLAIDSAKYAAGADVMYIRLANADPSTGWGGAITGFTLFYTAADIPETPVDDYEPIGFDVGAHKNRASKTVNLVTNAEADAPFIHLDNAVVDSAGNGKVCDYAKSISYRFALADYPAAVVVLNVAQNYHIQVSVDGVSWRTVQNYELANGSRATYMQGKTLIGISAEKYAPDADALYIRIAASDTSKGYGAVLCGFTVYYGEEKTVDPSTLLPTDKSYEDYQRIYADCNREEYIFNSSEPSDDSALIVRSTAKHDAKAGKYCDRTAELVYRFDLADYPEAVVVMKIWQNYLVQVSSDGENWTTVQDYILVNGTPVSDRKGCAAIAIATEDYAPDSDALYVRLACADVTRGWGGLLECFTIYYQ